MQKVGKKGACTNFKGKLWSDFCIQNLSPSTWMSWDSQFVWRSSCTVCSRKVFLPNVLACVSLGHPFSCRKSCTVCNWKASLLSVSACASWGCQLLCRNSCSVCKQKVFSTVNQLVCYQLWSTDGCVAALDATMGLLHIILKHVCFEIFGHLKGEIALNTWVRFVSSLHFHFISLECVVFNQFRNKVRGWLKTVFLKGVCF